MKDIPYNGLGLTDLFSHSLPATVDYAELNVI